MNLDVQAEQHVGASCIDVHGTAHHDEWMYANPSSSLEISTRFVEYWDGVDDTQRMGQHNDIPCNEFHSIYEVQRHYQEWMPSIAALLYDNDYGMHSPQNCTATHKGMSHANWMNNEKYLDWRGQSYWGDVTGVLSHEEWLIDGMWTYHQSLENDARRKDKAEQIAKQKQAEKSGELDKLWGLAIGIVLVIFVIWLVSSGDGSYDCERYDDCWDNPRGH